MRIEDNTPIPDIERSHPGPDEEMDRVMARMHVEGRMTLAAIADEYDLSRERVRQRVRRVGVSPEVTAEIKSEAMQVDPVEWECEGCGATKMLKPFIAGQRTYCSRQCHFANREEYTDDQLLDHLADLAQQLGHTPSISEINDHPGASHMVYYKRFGSLTRAAELVGLEPRVRGGAGHLTNIAEEDV